MEIKHLLVAVCLGLYAPTVFALKISGTPSGVSYYDPGTTSTTTPGTGTGTTTTNTTPTIYGGIAGNEGLCTTDGVNTCDNCVAVGATPQACNKTRIYPSLSMTIPLTDFGNSGIAYIKTTSSSGTTFPLNTTNFSISSVTLTWADLCGACTADEDIPATIWIDSVNANQQLDSNEPQLSIRIKIIGSSTTNVVDDCSVAKTASPTQNGVCYVRAYPGDQKIYITDPESSGSFPTIAGQRKITKLRVFLNSSTNGYNDAVPGKAEYEIDLTVDDSGAIVDRRARGLQNNVGYFIRVGQVDIAGNLDAVTSDANITANGCGAVMTAPPTGNMDCAYYAKPDEVLGLLSEDMNCFIATAAFGSQTEQYLNLLREFRFQKLIPTKMGREFVYQYYKYGPYAAKFITEHSWLKPIVRIALWPVISFSWMVLQFGWSIAILSYAFALMTFVFLTKLAVKRIRSQGSLRA